MTFCPNCGAQIPDGANACPNCGTFVNAQQPQQAQPVQPQYNNMPNMGYVKPKIPGRGLGIAALVCGIIGLILGFVAFIDAIASASIAGDFGSIGSAAADMVEDEYITSTIIKAVLSILGLSFGASAKSKGYNNGVSKGGYITGIIGLALCVLGIIIFVAI